MKGLVEGSAGGLSTLRANVRRLTGKEYHDEK
jgi:hypothetical protein